MAMSAAGLLLPTELLDLIREGRWPRTAEEAAEQYQHPFVAPQRYRKFDPHAPTLYLFPPPFLTLKQRIDTGETFWLDQMAAPSEISHALAIDLGDFGIGSDTAIVLDYSADRATPSVKYLKWGTQRDGRDNHWVVMADSFTAWCADLGLIDRTSKA